MRLLPCLILATAACAGDPRAIDVALAPSVISSLDGTTTVTALVSDGNQPLPEKPVHLTVAYADRNGAMHDVAPVDGTTDDRGVFTTTLTGLKWDGAGTVTAAVSDAVTGTADFAVLDRTPPAIEILPPTTDLHVGPGLPLDVQVHVTDEIGVSQVTLDDVGDVTGGRTTVVASGAPDTTITFRLNIPANAAAGPTIELHALASDLSGNLATAKAVTLTVDPAITIATPPGLAGTLLVDGTQQRLVSPRAIVMSAKDQHLYVADAAQTGACNPSCIWRIDPTSGAIDTNPIYVGQGSIEGLSLDATSDNLYVSDRPDRTTRLSWSGTAYGSAAPCSDPQQQRPQDPYHLIVDATLGLLVIDDNAQELVKLPLPCAGTSQATNVSQNGNFDRPRGVAGGPNGQLYVSDNGRDRVSIVDRTTGAVTAYAAINEPYGMEWLAGGTSQFADSLLVASQGDRIVASTKGGTSLAATYLRNAPIDLTVSGGAMYVITSPSNATRGRLYKVTGF